MALFPQPPSTLTSKPKPYHLLSSHKPHLALLSKKSLFLSRVAADDGVVGVTTAPAAVEAAEVGAVEKKKEEVSNGSASSSAVAAAVKAEEASAAAFGDPRWVEGTWDLKQFGDKGKTDWDAVIEAEARRRKWLEDNPESSNNDNPVVFDTSIIPWWAWVKKYHLPEAELLNGRAAMIGFFMAYFVDSLTGVGLVDQMGNFFCKTLLFISVVGVLLIRKNEDIESLKKLIEETTFYDKQWQATWKDDSTRDSTKE